MKIIKYIIVTALLVISYISPQAEARELKGGKTILAIYKSSDQYKASDNPIVWYFEKYIKEMGLKVKYHDFDSGLPDESDLKDVRGVITWYNSGLVKEKEIALDYYKFLHRVLDKDIKLMIVNSFGAYGYKEDGKDKWDLATDFEPLFNRMGFSFRGYWTDKPSLLKIVYKQRTMVEDGGKVQSVKKAKHYQQIIPLRDDVQAYLKIKRTDKYPGTGDGVSTVVMTSRNGGFAQEQYAFQNGKFMLNPVMFLKKSLFYDDKIQKVGVILGDLKNRKSMKNNLFYSFKYAKVKYDYLNYKKIGSYIKEDLIAYKAIAVVADDLEFIPIKLLEDYVKQGGNIIFLRYANVPEKYYKFLGIKKHSNYIESVKEGYVFKPEFYMGVQKKFGENIELNMKKVELNRVKLLAKSRKKNGSGEFPLLWERKIGKGKVLYWNTDTLFIGKSYRGAIIQSIHYCHNNYVTGLANVGMMMLDDYPAPLWNVNYKEYRLKYYSDLLEKETDEKKKKEYSLYIKRLKKYKNQTDREFITTDWLRDIKRWEKQLGFKYSAFLVFNYNKKTGATDGSHHNHGSFNVKDIYIARGITDIGKLVQKNGWEFAFHGFNHMSLTLTKPEEYDSTPWPDKSTMKKAIGVARKEWIKLYGHYSLPYSYVAPHNIIDETGLSALHEAFPSIKAVCALYSGYKDERSQEFQWYGEKMFFQVPRMTSGFAMKNNDIVALEDAIHNMGVVSHFVHPDDVFDLYRSYGFRGWPWMKKEFEKDFNHVNKKYPWLRWMTVRDAVPELKFYNSIDTRVTEEKNRVVVEFNDGTEKYFYFRMRLKRGKKIKRLVNCKKVSENKSTRDFVFKTTSARSEIIFR